MTPELFGKHSAVWDSWLNVMEPSDLPRPSSDTGAYRKARGWIGTAFLRVIGLRVTAHLQARVTSGDKCEGLVVKSIDGSSAQLEDTPENQAEYPQPTSQKPVCGFPVMGVLNHAHGGWEGYVTCRQTAHDAPGALRLRSHFGEGDLACADRVFRGYELVACLSGRGAHSLMRLHQTRHKALDFRGEERVAGDADLGGDDRTIDPPVPASRRARARRAISLYRSRVFVAGWQSFP